MRVRLLRVLAAAALAIGLSSCGPRVDLTLLEVTDVFSGWYDYGVVNGENKLVPSISFRLKNGGDVPATRVQLTVSFWRQGADGEQDSREVTGIGSDPVEPGGLSQPILVRSEVGYTTPGARSELFNHSQFTDFTAKIFAKRDGRIVPLGEFVLERRIIPQTSTARTP
jgi:hypothetical protein